MMISFLSLILLLFLFFEILLAVEEKGVSRLFFLMVEQQDSNQVHLCQLRERVTRMEHRQNDRGNQNHTEKKVNKKGVNKIFN